METTKRRWRWWVVGVAVPIIVGTIAILPQIRRSDRIVIRVDNKNHQGNVSFSTVNFVIEQARQSGGEVSEDVENILRQATRFVEAGEFDKAIPLFETAMRSVPVPAIVNNIWAAYLATGKPEKVEQNLKKAVARLPETEELSDADRGAIKRLFDKILFHYEAQDAAALAELMLTDVIFVLSGGSTVKGRAANEARWREDFSRYSGTIMTSQILEIQGIDSLAYVRARFLYKSTDRLSNKRSEAYAHGLSVLRKQSDGSWVLAVHMEVLE